MFFTAKLCSKCVSQNAENFGCLEGGGEFFPSCNEYFSSKIALAIIKFSSLIRLWSGKCLQTGWTHEVKDASYRLNFSVGQEDLRQLSQLKRAS